MADLKRRAALLAAIKNSPEDDLRRLVFADWVEENVTDDRDRAAAEHIRLTCQGASPRKSTPWLQENWRRLCPTLGTSIVLPAARAKEGKRVWVQRSVLGVLYDPPHLPDYQRPHGMQLHLRFDRGFCSHVRWRVRVPSQSPFPVDVYATLVHVLLRHDQPLAEFEEGSAIRY